MNKRQIVRDIVQKMHQKDPDMPRQTIMEAIMRETGMGEKAANTYLYSARNALGITSPGSRSDIDARQYFAEALKKAGWTQKELAQYLGISQQSVGEYIGGQRKLSADKKEEYDGLVGKIISKSAMRLRLDQQIAKAVRLDAKRSLKWDSRDAFADAAGLSRKLVTMAMQGYRMTPEFEEALEKALGPDPTVGELFGDDPDIKAMLQEINGKLDSLLQIVGRSN